VKIGVSAFTPFMKILLVKLSSLGDVVHALPVVQDIRAHLPDAQVDWVVEASFAPLLAASSGLHRVIPCEIRRWRKSLWTAATRMAWRAFKARLGQEAYDAVIDLQGLTKSAVVARMARLAPGGKRYALANQTDGSGYEAPTRWLADIAVTVEPHIAAVQRGRTLAGKALGYTPSPQPDFGLKPARSPTEHAPVAINSVASPVPPKSVALVHGTSRADKEWPLAHWTALGQRLQAQGFAVVLPHGNAGELATSQAIAASLNHGVPEGDSRAARVWPLLALDQLAGALAGCAGVIGVDSGVSHIAVALGLPHVQIYNFDTAWRTGPTSSPRQASVFARPTPHVDTVWQAWLHCVAASGQGVE
jgi:heptosyltransferase I